MKESMFRLANRMIAGLLALLLAAPLAQAAPSQQQQDQQQPAPQQPAQQPQQQPVPDQPQPAQNQPAPDQPQLVDRSAQPNAQTDQEKSGSGKPVGTAAAPVTKPTGVAGSRPAGAVIAPAKQKRVRAIWIRVGVIVGAGIAIGTVAALSRGSSSRP